MADFHLMRRGREVNSALRTNIESQEPVCVVRFTIRCSIWIIFRHKVSTIKAVHRLRTVCGGVTTQTLNMQSIPTPFNNGVPIVYARTSREWTLHALVIIKTLES